MFTPPPSPLPFPKLKPHLHPESSPSSSSEPTTKTNRRTSFRKLRWTILLVPLALVLITTSTRFVAHPATFDTFSNGASASWDALVSRSPTWTLHKRHPAPVPPDSSLNNQPLTSLFPSIMLSTSGTPTTMTPTTTALNSQVVPTIPSTAPPLPTPFPQPLDDLTQNFSSTSCFNFFTNMTNTQPFRSCRPLSLLLQSSSDFLQAQTNLTLLNSLVWGTCNTLIPQSQCTSNMAWFASKLKTDCVEDLADNNAYAVNTLTSLQAFSLMYTVGCLPDATTNAYCYLNAVRNPNPSDLFFYGLPLGMPVPQKSISLCSSCTGTIMQLYAAALKDPATAAGLTGLQQTYNAAAALADQQCGAAYVQTGLAVSSAGVSAALGRWMAALLLLMLAGWTVIS